MKRAVALGLAGLLSSSPIYSHHISQANIEKSTKIVVENKTYTYLKGSKEPIENGGTGFVLGDLYITADHVVSHYEQSFPTPFGVMSTPIDRVKEETKIDGIKLEELVNDKENDIAVFKLPPELCKKYCDYSVKVGNVPRVGDSVYLIGNPLLTGKTLKTAHISRLDIPRQVTEPSFQNGIGIDIPLLGGDSGSPVFNSKGELIGVAYATAAGIGYFKPILYFLKEIHGNSVYRR